MGKSKQIFLGLFTACVFWIIAFIHLATDNLTNDLNEYKFCIVKDFQTTECQKLVKDVKEQYVIKETVEKK